MKYCVGFCLNWIQYCGRTSVKLRPFHVFFVLCGFLFVYTRAILWYFLVSSDLLKTAQKKMKKFEHDFYQVSIYSLGNVYRYLLLVIIIIWDQNTFFVRNYKDKTRKSHLGLIVLCEAKSRSSLLCCLLLVIKCFGGFKKLL